jgi:hypothetical protein
VVIRERQVSPPFLPDDTLLLSAALFFKHGNAEKAADEMGVSSTAARSRIARARRKWPALFKGFSSTGGGTPDTELKELARAYGALHASGSLAKAAKALGMKRTTLQTRVNRWRELTGMERDDATLDPVTEHRKDGQIRVARANVRQMAAKVQALEDKLSGIEQALKASFEPAEWTLRQHATRKREHIPYVLTSDLHVGEVIDAAVTEAGYGYSTEIFRQRYRTLIDTVIYLSAHHGGTLWTYPGIIYARGGDTISGGIHEELRETDDATALQAIEVAFEEESAGIYKMIEAFGRVEVKTFGAGGNHDRNTVKLHTKNAAGHNHDRLVAFMLRREFSKNERVSFQISESFDVRFRIFNRSILLTHGHNMGARGGQGFVGPAATILRGVQRVIVEQAALGHHIDEVHHGHFHYPMLLPFVLSNGSFPGYSEYAKTNRMRPTPPQQALAYYHPKRGMVDFKPLLLTGDNR